MAHIEGLTIRRYRALRDVTLGKTFEHQENEPLMRMVAAIGPNGCGKSTLMDALGFLSDCMQVGVDEACDRPHRGGFQRLRTRGEEGPIEFEIYYRETRGSRPISYSLSVDIDRGGRAFVAHERLRQGRKGQKVGQPFSFLDLTDGRGLAWSGDAVSEEKVKERHQIELEDPQRLGIVTLGNLAEHPRIVAFREFLGSWYLSYFVPNQARLLPMTGAQKHLDREGQNLANYLQHFERTHRARLHDVLRRIAKRIPGIKKIDTKQSDDGRLLIRFNDRGYKDPFYASDMSDGTLKMLAYMLLLEDPEPAPLIGIEEPENGLHHQLLSGLADEMRAASAKLSGPQIFVTTHSPYFVDALTPEQVWILEKDKTGASTAQRAADIPAVKELNEEGLPLGSLWYSNHFGRGNP